jgi:hypothetical protein
MKNNHVLLNTRAGSTGEDWLIVKAESGPGGGLDLVTIRAVGGLSSTEISLDREEAEQVIDALRAFVG